MVNGYPKKFYVATVSTIPPRKCGVGKFNMDFHKSVMGGGALPPDERIYDFGLYPIFNNKEQLEFEPIIGKRIEKPVRQDKPQSWKKGLEHMIQKAGIMKEFGIPMGIFFQHEYGIFGANHNSDDNIVNLLRGLSENNIPTITIAHTLLSTPSPFKKDVMKGILKHTNKVVCITPSAITRFREVYGAERGKLVYIPHGVPHVEILESRDELKEREGYGDVDILLANVGYLSEGKGIEDLIGGLALYKARPNGRDKKVTVLIRGETHPEEVRKYGEKCRNSLIHRARNTGNLRVAVSNSRKRRNYSEYDIVFEKRHLTDKEYLETMIMSNGGIVTNREEDQISSGQLAYWTGVERAFLATESTYAKDMEDMGVGLLMRAGHPEDIDDRINFFVDLDSHARKNLENAAAGVAATSRWSIVGRTYINLMESVIRSYQN